MLEIFNRIFTEGSWQILWKHVTVIPILKHEKYKFKPDGYRPINLLNTLCKIFEKIINYSFTWISEKHNHLSKQQCGFRKTKNKSTIDNLIQINHEVNQTLTKKQIIGLVNLYIFKEYNSTWRHNILVKLNQILCKGKLLNVITNFIKDHTFRVKANNHISEEFTLENRVPRGTALSVTLFLIAISGITKCCSLLVKSNLFADDFNYSCRSNKFSSAQKHFLITKNNLAEWTKRQDSSFRQQNPTSSYSQKIET